MKHGIQNYNIMYNRKPNLIYVISALELNHESLVGTALMQTHKTDNKQEAWQDKIVRGVTGNILGNLR